MHKPAHNGTKYTSNYQNVRTQTEVLWAHSFSRLLNLSAQSSAVAQIWVLKYNKLLNLCIKLLIMRLNPYSKVVQSLSVCVCVCVRLNNSGTAGPIWLNFFLLAPSWSQGGFRPNKFWIRDPVFPEIRFLRYYLTNLAEIFRIYSSWPKYVLTQINFWIGYPAFRILNPVFTGKIRQNLVKTRFNSILWCDISFFIF